ncbi:Pyoverdine/dityrosine biosynthesis protein-domain-containing protein [Hypoxylon cercidicola]|nr:Pyoverdine/dityrosine biosynthesis protein-domain-containing protein [Hypoxylon cercidicola]
MEFPHHGESIYYRYQAAFARDRHGNLLYCNGPEADKISECWHSIRVRLVKENSIASKRRQVYQAKLGEDLQGLTVYEQYHASKGLIPGIVLGHGDENTDIKEDFVVFFNQLILHQVDFAIGSPKASQAPYKHHESAAEKIVSLFDTYLRYQGADDKWDACGKAHFTERIQHFTSRGIRVELCLPAFPCKSSNIDKVTGKDPDYGERLALERIHGFIEEVEKVYEGGAKLWIISDGHVFSDCIGVDDQDVDWYNGRLIEMNRAIGVRRGNVNRVGFKSLVDLFELEKYRSQSELSHLASQLDIPSIDHHVETRTTVEAELCRRILMAGCQSQRSALRQRIDSQDAAILALYRGFSRFMLEDLELHPFTRKMSRSKQKKLSAKVAFEMIMRNQAYSNLVELLFPNHVRLSIHAHNNAGPKFGIQLFDPATVRAVESLSPNGNPMTSRDLLHIPTPWHNCVVKMAGSEIWYVTKAKVVRQWPGKLEVQDNNGAVYFYLRNSHHCGSEGNKREAAKDEDLTILSRDNITSLEMFPARYIAAGSTALV